MDKKKILWISFCTHNYKILTDRCNYSLNKMLLFNDEYTHVIRQKGCSLKKGENTGFQSDSWYFCIYEKLKYASSSVYDSSDFDYIIVHDHDIQFFEHKWNELFEYIDNSRYSIFLMREGEEEEKMNGGFYIIKGHYYDEYVKFINILLCKDLKRYELGDQTYFNLNLHKLDYDFIPDKYIIWAKNIHGKNKDDVLLHHAVMDSKLDDKLKQMIEIDKWVNNNSYN